MPLCRIPDDIVLTAVSVFRSGKRKDDPVAQAAMEVFFSYIEQGRIKPETARKRLANKKTIADFIEKIRQRKQTKDILLKTIIERKRDKVLRTIVKQTDPKGTNKAGFMINMKAGAIYFLAGFLVSPLSSVIFKHQLAALDRWMYPDDYKNPQSSISESFPPSASTTDVFAQNASKTNSVSVDTVPIHSAAIELQTGSYAPCDPKTGDDMICFLNAGKAVSLPFKGKYVVIRPKSTAANPRFASPHK